MIKNLFVIIAFSFLLSCSKTVKDEVQVYTNDFESADLSKIANGRIILFNNSKVLGNFNNEDFALTLNNLPKHDLVRITFDLYLHDSWDGNKPSPDGPDIWQMLVDGNTYINASFSNSPCGPNVFCAPQSYPLDYPNSNSNPKAGAFRTDLLGLCQLIADPQGTTLYKIDKTVRHSSSTLIIQCLDKLVQTNTQNPKCDESWSVDNITVKAITL